MHNYVVPASVARAGGDRLQQVPRPGSQLAFRPPYSALPLPAGLFICQRASATRSICAFI
jgi:hypothetical protein